MMKYRLPKPLHDMTGARIVLTVLVLLLALCAPRTASAQLPTWNENNAYQAYTAYTSNAYFLYADPNPYFWSDPTGDGTTYSIIVDQQGDTSWSTFWQEVEKIELAEDAYYWAVHNGGTPSKYQDQINSLCQGFIDRMKPVTNFGTGAPWPPDNGDPYNWHGTDFKDINYSAEQTGNSSGNGDWFNDDLMWAAIAFARAYQITGTPGWLTAAENQVDYVWANAQAWTNATGAVVGLLQSFCNKNDGKDGDCMIADAASSPWHPNLDAEVNFTFVIAADLLANNTSGDTSTQYQNERNAVYAWAIAHLYDDSSSKATTCVQNAQSLGASTITTCAEIYDNDNTQTYNGENKYWSTYPVSPTKSDWDFSMNYGNAIQAAVRMGDANTAQNIANYLMYGMSNPNHPYAGTYQWDATLTYNILPYYGPWANKEVIVNPRPFIEFVPDGYDEGGNYAGSNGIALRGVAYGLFHTVQVNGTPQIALDNNTLQWAQANVQAAWNNRNGDNVMWDDWSPGHITGQYPYPDVTAAYIYDSWDCSDAVAGLLTVPPPPPQ